MSRAPEILHRRLDEILRWEKRKRIEHIVVAAFFYSLLAALLALPFYKILAPGALRWFVPAMLVLVLAPFLLVRQRWRHADSVRALARADRALRLEERALTAWDLLQRGEKGSAALMVFKEAADRLSAVHAQALFRRSWNRRAYVIVPLAMVWAALTWLDPSFEFAAVQRAAAPTLAHELRRFSRELQDKAKSDKLSESLRLANELEKVAQKAVESRAGDDRLKAEVAGMMKKFDLAGKTAAQPQSATAGESEQSLTDLKAELEAAREMLTSPNMAQAPPEMAKEWLDRLPSMPQLNRQFDRNGALERTLNRNELQSMLQQLDNQVSGELDRRALIDAQQFLERMMKQGNGETGEQNAQVAGRGKSQLEDGARGENKGELPGTEPGKKNEGLAALPEMQGGAPTQLKGTVGAGESSALLLKTKPSVGKSETPQDEIIASYQRQAEAELNSERVPESLKETIKQYFLSLSGAVGEAGREQKK